MSICPYKVFRRVVLVSFCLLSVACASSKDVDLLREEITRVKQEAEEAKKLSQQALNRAQAAEELAQNSKARSMRTEEAFNRAFKKSMYK